MSGEWSLMTMSSGFLSAIDLALPFLTLVQEQTLSAVSSFSMVELFHSADWIVKSVMVILVFASILSWAILIDRWLFIGGLNSKAQRFEDTFWTGGRLEELASKEDKRKRHPMARIYLAAMRETREQSRGDNVEGLTGRLDRSIRAAINRENARMGRGLTVLATIASSSPFIGLFGTVWGIMNAFRAIAASQDTNLATVAPGIAEALFATALGLLAAIPATIFYNKLSADIGQYTLRLEAFADDLVARLLRRASDKRSV